MLRAFQRAYVRRVAARASAARPGEESHEINVVPFLDIITNVLMFLLATMAVVFTTRTPVRTPGSCSVNCPEPPMSLTVKIVSDGFIIASPLGYLQSDCQSLGGATIAVPRRIGAFDTARLTECLSRARDVPALRSHLAGQHEIQIAGQSDIPYATLTATIDAARETRQGARDLFPDVRLGLLM